MRESQYNVWLERDDGDYVYNGVTGSLLSTPRGAREGVRRVLAGESDPRVPVKLLEQMAVGRMLVGDGADEVEVLANRYRASRDDTSRFTLTILTSLGCNFDCPYCFEAKHPSIMAPDVQDAVLAALDDQLPHIRTFHVSWFGGEPLVGKRPLLDLSDRFIERCQPAGVEYSASITTNGYLLDEATCRALHDRRLTDVQVGLDGPPEIHDRMRPLANGDPSFWRIVENVHHAVDYFTVSIRVNIDTGNVDRLEELLVLLQQEGLSGRCGVYVGQLVGVENGGAPSSTYSTRCLTNPEFARAEYEFVDLATRYGFSSARLPSPIGAPCTAVRANELVVGSSGELYKCWDTVGNPRDVIGDIRDYRNRNGRLAKWLAYDPFANEECRTCIALPVCMGGCAHHAFDLLQYENRCGTFRHTYLEQVDRFVTAAREPGPVPVAIGAPSAIRRLESR